MYPAEYSMMHRMLTKDWNDIFKVNGPVWIFMVPGANLYSMYQIAVYDMCVVNCSINLTHQWTVISSLLQGDRINFYSGIKQYCVCLLLHQAEFT